MSITLWVPMKSRQRSNADNAPSCSFGVALPQAAAPRGAPGRKRGDGLQDFPKKSRGRSPIDLEDCASEKNSRKVHE